MMCGVQEGRDGREGEEVKTNKAKGSLNQEYNFIFYFINDNIYISTS